MSKPACSCQFALLTLAVVACIALPFATRADDPPPYYPNPAPYVQIPESPPGISPRIVLLIAIHRDVQATRRDIAEIHSELDALRKAKLCSH